MSENIAIYVNGESHCVPAGLSVAVALHAVLRNSRFRHTPQLLEPRGMFCGMGLCFDCLLTIDGRKEVRACMTPVKEGMRIEIA